MNYERGALNDSSYNHFPPFIKVPESIARGFLMPETSQNCTPHTFVVSQDFRFLPLKQRNITTSKNNLTKDCEIRPLE